MRDAPENTDERDPPRMMRFLPALALTLMTVLPTAAQTQSADQAITEDDVRRLVLETILDNPEIIMEAVAILQQREEEAQAAAAVVALQENRELLFNDPEAEVFGNPNGDVTLVEFFDYNCHYCRIAGPRVAELLETDPNLRIVMREFPILGEGSVEASRAALAARGQDGYEDFHWALMEMKGPAQMASALKLARDMGLDAEQMRVDMESPEVDRYIQTSRALAQALGINSTPSFVIGDTVVPGALPLEEMQRLIAEEREKG